MLILALDTTTPFGSAAVSDDRVHTEEALDASRPLATQLPGALKGILERAGRELREIDLFAVATGPGSFTGIRIGIATMQGLAFANERPLVGVSAFDALARIASVHQRHGSAIATWVDAWRGEVYAATYDGSATEPVVAKPDDLLRGPSRIDVAIGDAAVRYRDAIRAARPGVTIVEPTPRLALTIARLANARAAAGELPSPHAIRPLYVRRPDAELAKEKRPG